MIRFLFRFLGILLLAAAFAALIIDGTKSIAANSVLYTMTGDTARALVPAKFVLLQPAMERIHPLLWDPGMVTILKLPVWVVIGVIGALCLLVARKRRPPIGYSSR
ncbi:MAG: hypothetical protein NVSMB26_23620 [Beijerinckiaceae bacterium]